MNKSRRSGTQYSERKTGGAEGQSGVPSIAKKGRRDYQLSGRKVSINR